MNEPGQVNMNSPLDDIAFLALSENRITILGILTDEELHSRDELMEATDVSRPTLTRILDDLESRTWITQRGQNCRITSLGAWVHEEFIELMETMTTARKLRDVVQWLPPGTLPFDVRCLAEATLTFPSQSDPLAPMKRASALARTAKRSRLVTHSFPTPCLNAHWQAITTGTGQFDVVVTPSVVETMTEPEHVSQFVDILTADQAAVFVYDDTIPDVVGINDSVVYFGVDDDKGAPLALIETDDETVLRWAEEAFESYRERSSRLTPDRFTRIQETTQDSERTAELVDAP